MCRDMLIAMNRWLDYKDALGLTISHLDHWDIVETAGNVDLDAFRWKKRKGSEAEAEIDRPEAC